MDGMARSSRINVPLRWRVILLLVALATLTIVNTALARNEIVNVSTLERADAKLDDAGGALEELQATETDQALSIRGFALTGEESFLRAYQAQRLEERGLEAELRTDLAGEEQLLKQSDQMQGVMAEWRREAVAPILAAPPEQLIRTGARVAAGPGDELFNRLREADKRLDEALDARHDAVHSEILAARSRLNAALLTTSALALAVVLASAWAMRRWITAPVDVLSVRTDQVAAGDLDTHIRGIGPPEFERIGANVERMRRRIVNELRATRQAIEGLEQNAPLVASIREQLAASPDVDLPESLQVVARMEPAHGVLAGDWYDVLNVDGQHVTLVVVDVSGHGPRAGLRALWLKHLLVPAIHMGLQPGEALNWVASEMGATEEWFATCVIIDVDSTTGECRYANAGHLPPLLFGPDGVVELTGTGPIFGPLPDQRWSTGSVSLGPSEMLAVYTDGITEARNSAGEEFGERRLISLFPSESRRDVSRLTDDVMDSVHMFGSDRLKDDATLAVVTYGD
jgi:serine phosphatase RsbU (regulator of sigma subunit)